MDAASLLLPGTGHYCKESSVLPALVLIASPSILPSYLYIFCTYYLAEHCNKHLHILALLGRLIEDHPILVDALLKVIELELPSTISQVGAPSEETGKAALGRGLQ